MFRKHPEKYRGTVCWVLSALIIVLFAVQFYFTTLPCVPIEDVKNDNVVKNFSMADFMFTKTDKITDLYKAYYDNYKFSINPYADMTAYAIALGITMVIMSLASLKCFATHIVSVVYVFWSVAAWSSSKIWEVATLPIGKTIHTVINVTMYASLVLVLVRTAIYLTYRFGIPFVKWRKATKEWREIYEEAKAAEAAEAAETAAN